MELKNISFSYETTVLKDITASFEKGKISAIIGPSGSGKTTLIELLATFLKPSHGTIEIEKDKRIGVVFEFPDKQFFKPTIKEELKYGLKNKNNDKKIVDVLEMVGLSEDFLERSPHCLSNGEKRRVAIATILITNPDVIILDEPTVGLDMNNKNNIIRLLKILKTKYNKTIIVVSQDIDFINKFVDNVYVLHNSQLIFTGEREKVLNNIDVLKKYNIKPPKIVEFIDKINVKKGVNVIYRDDINDLLKDIYRYVK